MWVKREVKSDPDSHREKKTVRITNKALFPVKDIF